jgi:transposase
MFLGLDISKNTLDVTLLTDSTKPRHKVFPNTATGHPQLLKWLQSQGATPVHACLEATGTWGEAIALALHQARHQVSIVNPAADSWLQPKPAFRTKQTKPTLC